MHASSSSMAEKKKRMNGDTQTNREREKKKRSNNILGKLIGWGVLLKDVNDHFYYWGLVFVVFNFLESVIIIGGTIFIFEKE